MAANGVPECRRLKALLADKALATSLAEHIDGGSFRARRRGCIHFLQITLAIVVSRRHLNA